MCARPTRTIKNAVDHSTYPQDLGRSAVVCATLGDDRGTYTISKRRIKAAIKAGKKV